MSSLEPEVDTKSETNNGIEKNANIKENSSQQYGVASSHRLYVKSLDHMFYDTIDGVNYYSVTANGRVKNQLSIIPSLDLRSDDVILVGYPKSGNHWLLEVMTMILRQNTEFNERVYHLNMLEFLNVEVQKVLNAIDSPRCLTSHLRCHRLPLQVVEKRLKIVYILRNPKDVLASLYYMFNSNGPDFTRFNGNFSEFFDIYMKGEFFWGYWFDHILSYEAFINENPEHPIFVLTYEKMKEDPVKTIRDLCAFLEKPDYLAEDIARVTEFHNLKNELYDGKMKHIKRLVCQKDKEFIFRKGEIGDWKNWLTTEQSEAFDKVLEERMAGSKLVDLVRKYL